MTPWYPAQQCCGADSKQPAPANLFLDKFKLVTDTLKKKYFENRFQELDLRGSSK